MNQSDALSTQGSLSLREMYHVNRKIRRKSWNSSIISNRSTVVTQITMEAFKAKKSMIRHPAIDIKNLRSKL
jgi:hypothetical protein